jgi:lipid-binding SYLF domain-containing protein
VAKWRSYPKRHAFTGSREPRFPEAACAGRDVARLDLRRRAVARALPTLEKDMLSRLLTVFTHLAIAASVLLTTPLLGRANAEDQEVIDAKVNAALARFRKQVNGAEEYLSAAKGVLIVPDVRKAGFVVAGQWGKGALRVGGRDVAYYKMEGGSAGFQAGYEEGDFVFLFLTEAALQKFRASNGWTIGTDAEVTVIDKAAGLSADTLKTSKPVMAFVIGQKGLMAGWSAKGTKFTPFEPKD